MNSATHLTISRWPQRIRLVIDGASLSVMHAAGMGTYYDCIQLMVRFSSRGACAHIDASRLSMKNPNTTVIA